MLQNKRGVINLFDVDIAMDKLCVKEDEEPIVGQMVAQTLVQGLRRVKGNMFE